ncbi:hypothetical protein Tfer_1082 [Thermincola ferriacetica]|uniref:Uncharacterized protein n=1 Tax=Thermincola ferriacetica TaxID=281456 RepID=A0A0L6W3P4_9FIRM|nr:hypothetical protein [Thermincola ferriacetica]KNZ70207.1 hypothetical protein Tfer_1082 [Thermincola ferriacetica]
MKKKLFFSVAIIAILTVTIFLNNSSTKVVQAGLNNDINQMMEEVADNSADPKIAMSSNPYDYIKNNEGFNNLVAYGFDGLPELRNKIRNSPNNGLEEYLLAIAIEKITKLNLKGENYGWTNAKEFSKAFDNHLKSIPNQVTNIVKSSDPDDIKIKNLIRLGTPAIPYIMDQIEAGDLVQSANQ